MEENKTTAPAAKKPYKRVPRNKDVARLKKFVTEGGKMVPRRMSGTCAKHQRELSKAIKRARIAALLPFKAE